MQVMDLKAKVLEAIRKDGHGIEIGPSVNPIASKKDGYRVHTIDHMSRDQLMAKYRDHHVNLDNIEEVDFVWRGESYAELTGRRKYYDWIIASHVVEHTPDLIGFFNDCDAILKDDGVIVLIIPDKRYCFDHYRPLTGLAAIIDSHLAQNRIHTPGTVAEYFLNVVTKAGHIAWNTDTTGTYQTLHTLEHALEGMELVRAHKAYLDVHAWCFVPHSFRLILHDLFCLGLIPFQETDFAPTQACEFYMALGRRGSGIQPSRLEMLERIEREIGVPAPAGFTRAGPASRALPQTLATIIRDLIQWLRNRLRV